MSKDFIDTYIVSMQKFIDNYKSTLRWLSWSVFILYVAATLLSIRTCVLTNRIEKLETTCLMKGEF